MLIRQPSRRELFAYGGATLAALGRMRAQTISAGVTISRSSSPAPGLSLFVNTASTSGGDGTTNATSGANRAYPSLFAAFAVLNNTTLTKQTTIFCTGTDTTAVTSMDVGTTAANYLLVTPAPGQRHAGVWDSTKYNLSATDIYVLRNNTTSYLRIDGLQIHFTQNSGTHYGTKILGQNNIGPFDIRYSNLIVKGTVAANSATGIVCDDPGSGSGICQCWNCIVYGFPSGYSGLAQMANAGYTLYNSTAFGNSFSFVVDGNWTIKNCISASPTSNDFAGTPNAASDYNAASGSASGAHSRSSQTFSFVNSSIFDLHLQAGDTGARGFGLTDPASGLFADDIDGQTRGTPWSIGADQ